MQTPNLNDLIQDLQLAKQMAIDDKNPNALVVATIAQAKLLGLDKPINDVTLYNQEPAPIPDYSILSDDELRQLKAIGEKMQKVVTHC